MYGFGDALDPDPNSVALLEEMTTEFMTDLCHRARPSPYTVGSTSQVLPQLLPGAVPGTSGAAGGGGGRTSHPYTRHRLKLDDVKHALRKDTKKSGRAEELLYLERVINQARKVLADDPAELAREEEAAAAAERAQRERMEKANRGREVRGGVALPRGVAANEEQMQE